MLDKMRSHRSNQLLKIFVYSAFAIIIVVFAISFGPGSWGRSGGPGQISQAAVVNGQVITARELESAYGNYAERYRQITGQPLNDAQAKAMGVRRQLLDSLIDRELVAEAAKDNGIQVSDQELAKAIQDIPGFQPNGTFDPDYYRRYVTNVLGSSPARFEEGLRKSMLQEKALKALEESVKVSPSEVQAQYVQDNDKIDLAYVRLSPMQYQKAVTPSDAQIDEVLKTREDEVKAYFDRNKWRFDRPKRVRASQVLVRVPQDATQAQRDEAKKKAEEVLAKAKSGEDFAKLAEEYSDDEGSKDKGGDLNWFGPGTMAPPVQQAAFATAKGKVYDGVVKTDLGYHVLKVTDEQPAVSKTLDEVKREIAGDLVKQDAADAAAKAEAERILADAKAGKPLEEIAPKAAPIDPKAPPKPELVGGNTPKPETRETGLVALKAGYIPGIGRDAALAGKVRDLTQDAPLLPEVAKVGDSYYVVQLLQRQEPDMAQFAEKEPEIRKQLLTSRQREVQEAWVRSLRDDARIEVNEVVVSAEG